MVMPMHQQGTGTGTHHPPLPPIRPLSLTKRTSITACGWSESEGPMQAPTPATSTPAARSCSSAQAMSKRPAAMVQLPAKPAGKGGRRWARQRGGWGASYLACGPVRATLYTLRVLHRPYIRPYRGWCLAQCSASMQCYLAQCSASVQCRTCSVVPPAPGLVLGLVEDLVGAQVALVLLHHLQGRVVEEGRREGRKQWTWNT